jgi:hypothetical protein
MSFWKRYLSSEKRFEELEWSEEKYTRGQKGYTENGMRHQKNDLKNPKKIVMVRRNRRSEGSQRKSGTRQQVVVTWWCGRSNRSTSAW